MIFSLHVGEMKRLSLNERRNILFIVIIGKKGNFGVIIGLVEKNLIEQYKIHTISSVI